MTEKERAKLKKRKPKSKQNKAKNQQRQLVEREGGWKEGGSLLPKNETPGAVVVVVEVVVVVVWLYTILS